MIQLATHASQRAVLMTRFMLYDTAADQCGHSPMACPFGKQFSLWLHDLTDWHRGACTSLILPCLAEARGWDFASNQCTSVLRLSLQANLQHAWAEVGRCCTAGLPENWAQHEGDQDFGAGGFDQGGVMPKVEDNVQLVKGLFSDSLPPFLNLQARLLPFRAFLEH